MKRTYYPKAQIKEIFPEPGIYKLLTKELNIVYIGQSVNLRKRLVEHSNTTYMEFYYFDYDFFPRNKLDDVERDELGKFEEEYLCLPKYNNQRGNKRTSKIFNSSYQTVLV